MAQFVDPNVMMFTSFEPIQKNRFFFEIENIPVYLIRKCTIPKVTSTEVNMKHMNVNWFVKGRTTWDPVTIELFNPIAPSGGQIAMEYIRLSHESASGRDSYSDVYKKDCGINILGPVGDIVQHWTLKGAWVKSVDMGDFTFDSDGEASIITMELQIDFAILDF